MSTTFKQLCSSVIGFGEDVIKSAAPAGKAIQYSTATAAAAAMQAFLAVKPTEDEVAEAEKALELFMKK